MRFRTKQHSVDRDVKGVETPLTWRWIWLDYDVADDKLCVYYGPYQAHRKQKLKLKQMTRENVHLWFIEMGDRKAEPRYFHQGDPYVEGAERLLAALEEMTSMPIVEEARRAALAEHDYVQWMLDCYQEDKEACKDLEEEEPKEEPDENQVQVQSPDRQHSKGRAYTTKFTW